MRSRSRCVCLALEFEGKRRHEDSDQRQGDAAVDVERTLGKYIMIQADFRQAVVGSGGVDAVDACRLYPSTRRDRAVHGSEKGGPVTTRQSSNGPRSSPRTLGIICQSHFTDLVAHAVFALAKFQGILGIATRSADD